MQTALKVISILLTYPTAQMQEASSELKEAIAGEESLDKRGKRLLSELAENIASLDLYDAQERYVFLFDRTRTLSLHLFEHVHGESRDRGQAMVDLMQMYDADGLDIDAKELPDFLPMFLEYLSMKPAEEIAELLSQTTHILAALRQRLKKRKSIYANAFGVLESLSRDAADPKLLKELLDTPEDDPADLQALDEIWEEEAVTFGGNAGENECGPDRIKRQLRAHTRKPDAPAAPTSH